MLNLKHLNHEANHKKFKTASLNRVFKIVKNGASITSVDLKDTLLKVPVHNLHQNVFKFEWIQNFFEFVGMPNGYLDTMNISLNL